MTKFVVTVDPDDPSQSGYSGITQDEEGVKIDRDLTILGYKGLYLEGDLDIAGSCLIDGSVSLGINEMNYTTSIPLILLTKVLTLIHGGPWGTTYTTAITDGHEGQMKMIRFDSTVGGDATVYMYSAYGPYSKIRFFAVGCYAYLIFTGGAWNIMSYYGTLEN